MATSSSSLNHSRTPLRLVSTKGMDRETWLDYRKHGIGSSDAAAAVGVNPYQSMLELWLIKTGRDDGLNGIDPNDDSHPTYWGSRLESIVADHYAHKTGRRVRRINAVLQHPDTDKPWMLANIDREILGCHDVQILECKTAGEFGARLWKDGVPDYVVCQVQHQLAVTGKQAADVGVLLCGQEYRIYRIERDEELIASLITLERRFWNYVETDTPPPADGSESAAAALNCLYPRDNGHIIDLTGDATLGAVFDELMNTRGMLSTYEKQEALLRQRIQETMGDASRALFANGRVSWKRSKDSTVLDVQKLTADQPDLIDRYPLTKAGTRRFLITASSSEQFTES